MEGVNSKKPKRSQDKRGKTSLASVSETRDAADAGNTAPASVPSVPSIRVTRSRATSRGTTGKNIGPRPESVSSDIAQPGPSRAQGGDLGATSSSVAVPTTHSAAAKAKPSRRQALRSSRRGHLDSEDHVRLPSQQNAVADILSTSASWTSLEETDPEEESARHIAKQRRRLSQEAQKAAIHRLGSLYKRVSKALQTIMPADKKIKILTEFEESGADRDILTPYFGPDLERQLTLYNIGGRGAPASGTMSGPSGGSHETACRDEHAEEDEEERELHPDGRLRRKAIYHSLEFTSAQPPYEELVESLGSSDQEQASTAEDQLPDEQSPPSMRSTSSEDGSMVPYLAVEAVDQLAAILRVAHLKRLRAQEKKEADAESSSVLPTRKSSQVKDDPNSQSPRVLSGEPSRFQEAALTSPVPSSSSENTARPGTPFILYRSVGTDAPDDIQTACVSAERREQSDACRWPGRALRLTRASPQMEQADLLPRLGRRRTVSEGSGSPCIVKYMSDGSGLPHVDLASRKDTSSQVPEIADKSPRKLQLSTSQPNLTTSPKMSHQDIFNLCKKVTQEANVEVLSSAMDVINGRNAQFWEEALWEAVSILSRSQSSSPSSEPLSEHPTEEELVVLPGQNPHHGSLSAMDLESAQSTERGDLQQTGQTVPPASTLPSTSRAGSSHKPRSQLEDIVSVTPISDTSCLASTLPSTSRAGSSHKSRCQLEDIVSVTPISDTSCLASTLPSTSRAGSSHKPRCQLEDIVSATPIPDADRSKFKAARERKDVLLQLYSTKNTRRTSAAAKDSITPFGGSVHSTRDSLPAADVPSTSHHSVVTPDGRTVCGCMKDLVFQVGPNSPPCSSCSPPSLEHSVPENLVHSPICSTVPKPTETTSSGSGQISQATAGNDPQAGGETAQAGPSSGRTSTPLPLEVLVDRTLPSDLPDPSTVSFGRVLTDDMLCNYDSFMRRWVEILHIGLRRMDVACSDPATSGPTNTRYEQTLQELWTAVQSGREAVNTFMENHKFAKSAFILRKYQIQKAAELKIRSSKMRTTDV